MVGPALVGFAAVDSVNSVHSRSVQLSLADSLKNDPVKLAFEIGVTRPFGSAPSVSIGLFEVSASLAKRYFSQGVVHERFSFHYYSTTSRRLYLVIQVQSSWNLPLPTRGNYNEALGYGESFLGKLPQYELNTTGNPIKESDIGMANSTSSSDIQMQTLKAQVRQSDAWQSAK
ncbi:hypothetical protein BDV26DRAFT_288222 [Aspergillus bertholletiae]|uniref:Uncharacterized protein n=1 Tax=Aspergillus bertholletiae TaxID=1226010 RepID=A0A5N7BLP7_9EURO|nr:hypothetical protein BDV26DRAFT_288222 [Aspergillus bertholletiae]